LPGTKPVAMISASVPVSVAARVSTASLATSWGTAVETVGF
jgi:hypothetical protein